MLPAKVHLAITAAAEHYTAVLGARVLSKEEIQAIPGDPEVWHLLNWHAMEELEHKSVAFDVYRAVGGPEWIRIAVMWFMYYVTIPFVTAAVMVSMLMDPTAWRPIKVLRQTYGVFRGPLGARPAWRRFTSTCGRVFIPTMSRPVSSWTVGRRNCSAPRVTSSTTSANHRPRNTMTTSIDVERPPVAERIDPDHEVVVVGAGFGGIGTGIALQRKGIHDFVIVDKWDHVGGTWHANTYPGVAVDIPSVIYSFSYEQRGDWSRVFAPGAELRDYADHMVDKYGLRDKLRLNTTVTGATFDERNSLWRLTTDGGAEITGRHVVMAVGGLERPKMPDIPGLHDFGGVLMHTALWDHDVALAGKRVAVIGTGATSLQVVPAIVDEVEHLTVFQRTPIWVFPKRDGEIRGIARKVMERKRLRSTIRAVGTVATEIGMSGMLAGPGWMVNSTRKLAEAPARAWMRRQVKDPVIREKLIPRYGLGCKRPSMSNDYLKTFNRSDVSLVTDSIERDHRERGGDRGRRRA